MSTVNNISPIDGSAYLVSTGNSVNATSGTDFDKIYNDIAVDDSLESIFAGAAKEFGINENFLKAVAKAESGFDPDAVSGCGAQGIMQLMPFTSESYGVTDPFDAKQNIYAGAQLFQNFWIIIMVMQLLHLLLIMQEAVLYRNTEECLHMMKLLIT